MARPGWNIGANMQFENPQTFVRSLKGAPASVLWAFFFCRRAMTALELQEWTGYGGDNLTVALRLLVNLGWLAARSSRGPWTLVEGRQLPLMAESDLIGFREVSSSSSPLLNFPLPLEQEQEEEEHESDLIGFVENLRACDAVGIREPKRKQIARLSHVTPELIRGHVAWALRDGHQVGTAIYRIINNWELPEGESGDILSVVDRGRRGQETFRMPADLVDEVAAFTGHRRECKCLECTVGRFQGISSLCPDCKKYRCECEEE